MQPDFGFVAFENHGAIKRTPEVVVDDDDSSSAIGDEFKCDKMDVDH